jgi:hypothetical protein
VRQTNQEESKTKRSICSKHFMQKERAWEGGKPGKTAPGGAYARMGTGVKDPPTLRPGLAIRISRFLAVPFRVVPE